jgi:hypothetical protein
VGYEFEPDKTNLHQYGWDYMVAMTAAAFPWVFVVLYFIFVLLPAGAWGSWQAWVEALLAGRFAAPTSAGVLFAMLAAAGLSATWLFAKARILAIFDDLDTVLLMIPLQMLIIGLAWQWGGGGPHGRDPLGGLARPAPLPPAGDLALGPDLRGGDHRAE